ncbi:ABC transporter substrate-binding protein [bacterium]|nr:ABC transporter substrate-binding protein [bacterium]
MSSTRAKIVRAGKKIRRWISWRWRILFSSFSLKERKLLAVLVLLFVVLWVFRGYLLFLNLAEEKPKEGGTYREVSFGELNSFVPFFAESRIEKDIARLLFLNLVDYDEKGSLSGEILRDYKLGEKSGRLKFRQGLYWHDGHKLSADDFLFTLEVFRQNSSLSLWADLWSKVKVQKKNDYEVILSYPSGWLKPKSLRFPLLPRHVLKGKNLERLQGFSYNLKPIGNGPFTLTRLVRLQTGEVLITLKRFEKSIRRPFLEKIEFTVEPSAEKAWEKFVSSPFLGLAQVPWEKLETKKEGNFQLHFVSLPQYTAVFYNLKKDKFKDKNVRLGLDRAINRAEICQRLGFVEPTLLPLPAGAIKEKSVFNLREARQLLPDNFSVELSYLDRYPFNETARLIASHWKRAGVKVELLGLEEEALSEKVFSGDFEAVIWGEVVGRDWDLTRWSSESEMNFSGFSSSQIDTYLAGKLSRQGKIEVAQKIRDQIPASFLYSLPYVWASRSLKGVSLTVKGEEPADRFREIIKWYLARRK